MQILPDNVRYHLVIPTRFQNAHQHRKLEEMVPASGSRGNGHLQLDIGRWIFGQRSEKLPLLGSELPLVADAAYGPGAKTGVGMLQQSVNQLIAVATQCKSNKCRVKAGLPQLLF